MCVSCDREPIPVSEDSYKSALAILADNLLKWGLRSASANALIQQPILCANREDGQHTIGSRPNECLDCMRTRDNAR